MAKKDTNKELHNQLVYTRQLLDEMTGKYYAAKEEAEENFKAMDAAYKEQEQMLVELNRNLYMFKIHCLNVNASAGEIGTEDIAYGIDLIKRIMNNKYGPKPDNDGRDS